MFQMGMTARAGLIKVGSQELPLGLPLGHRVPGYQDLDPLSLLSQAVSMGLDWK